MSNKQPEALRLAEAWDEKLSAYGHSELATASAAELRRQHALIEEMVGVLREIRENGFSWDSDYDKTLAKAEAQQ